jgi:predicted amidohydrolase
MTSAKQVTLVAVQDAPVAFDLPSSIDKLRILTREAVQKVRQEGDGQVERPIVVVFPEAFLSCYPRGYDFGAKIGARTPEGRSWFRRYHQSSVPVRNTDGPEMRAIRQVASENQVTLVVGVIERCDEPVSGMHPAEYGSGNPGGEATLYCTALTISPEGKLLASHRKLMPTGTERLVWGQGDGAGLRVSDTPAGKVGVAICWENYMPLLRYALYAKGMTILCSPTADGRDTWLPSMQHIAQEGRCFVISCNQFNRRRDFPDDYPALYDLKSDDIVTRGGSVIVGPLGEILAGPLFDAKGILYAHVDTTQIVESRMDFDPCGHYARPDVFSLQFDDSSKLASQNLPHN